MQRPRKRNRLAHMVQPADPGYGSLDPHAEGKKEAEVMQV
jgi:hypothetical protein